MSAITPSFLFEREAFEAATFYVGIFPNSAIGHVSHYGAGAPLPEGTVLTVDFRLGEQSYTAINAGVPMTFTEALSLRVACADQADVDYYWSRLGEGGEEGRCGWLKDRFGVSWQVVPNQLGAYLGASDPERAARAMAAMLTMSKLDLAEFERVAGPLS